MAQRVECAPLWWRGAAGKPFWPELVLLGGSGVVEFPFCSVGV